MKKLCIIGNPNIVHVKRWVTDFARIGWEVHLIGEHKLVTDLPGVCRFYDLPKIFNLRKFRYLLWFYWVRKIIHKESPAVLHALGVASAGWLGAASQFHPFICTALGSDLLLLDNRSKIHQQLSRLTLKNVDKLICVSEPLYTKADELGVPATKRELISLGVNTDLFTPVQDKTQIRQKLNLPDQPIVLSIRAIHPLYQPLKLARAIPEVLKQIPNAVFVIFTYNADLDLLREFENELNMNSVINKVHFVPPIYEDERIADYFRAADIVVSIPTSDGMPVSVMESMACGAALIATDLPNLNGWIQNEREGILIPLNEDEALIKALILVLSNPSMMHAMQRNAVETIQNLEERSSVLEKIQKIYTNQEKFSGITNNG